MKNHFKGFALGGHTAKDINTAFAKALGENQLMFGLRWTKTRHILLYKLHVRATGKPWHNVLQNTVPDNDGTLAIPLGNPPSGTKVEVAFGVMGETAVPKMIALIGQTSPQNAIQVAPLPSGSTKALKATETWEVSVKYTVL